MADYTDWEAAIALGVHVRSVQRYCTSGRLRGAHKIGRTWRIPPASLREFQLAEQRIDDPAIAELRAANDATVHLGERFNLARAVGADDDLDWHHAARELRQLATVAFRVLRDVETGLASGRPEA